MEKKAKTAPYVPFPTFLSALDNIGSVGVPNIIDRHSFPSFSGANVSSTLVALKFFGLVDEEGKPSDALHGLAMEKEGRKKAIGTLLQKYYGNIFAIDLTRATPPQLDNAFTAELYNVSGDTKTKAKTFFLKAAQFAEVPISKLLLKKSRASGPRKPRGKRVDLGSQGSAGSGSNSDTSDDRQTTTSATEKTIELGSGGTLTLSLDVNILELKGKDRNFVFKLIDSIDAYEMGVDNQDDKEVML